MVKHCFIYSFHDQGWDFIVLCWGWGSGEGLEKDPWCLFVAN